MFAHPSCSTARLSVSDGAQSEPGADNLSRRRSMSDDIRLSIKRRTDCRSDRKTFAAFRARSRVRTSLRLNRIHQLGIRRFIGIMASPVGHIDCHLLYIIVG